MPTYKRRRTYYRRTRYARKRWTPYTSEVTIQPGQNQLGSGYFVQLTCPLIYGANESLTAAAAASSPSSAVTYTVCRPRLKGVFTSAPNNPITMLCAICYVPQSYEISNTAAAVANLATAYFYRHPENVVAWNRIDYVNNTGDTGEVSLYSITKRRLQTGDRMVCYILFKNDTDAAQLAPNFVGTFSCYLRTN